MPEWVTNLLTVLMPAVSSIIVAFFGWKISVSEKESKRNQELREAAAKKDEQERVDKENAVASKLSSIESSLQKLTDTVEGLSDEMSSTKTRMESLIEASNLNIRYSRSMSAVINSIGSALTHSSSLSEDGISEIHTAVSKHQDEEAQILTQIFKISY